MPLGLLARLELPVVRLRRRLRPSQPTARTHDDSPECAASSSIFSFPGRAACTDARLSPRPTRQTLSAQVMRKPALTPPHLTPLPRAWPRSPPRTCHNRRQLAYRLAIAGRRSAAEASWPVSLAASS